MAKEHLKDIKSLTRRLEIKIESLEKQLEEKQFVIERYTKNELRIASY